MTRQQARGELLNRRAAEGKAARYALQAEAHDAGKAAYAAGQPMSANPYGKRTEAHEDWAEGWEAAGGVL